MADLASTSDGRLSLRFRRPCRIDPDRTPHRPISEAVFTRLDHNREDNKQIPALRTTNHEKKPSMEGIRCCCRKLDCVYLEHNNAALVGLEKDLETAARLGKVRAL